MPNMILRIGQATRNHVADWTRRQAERTAQCRECDAVVDLMETVCPRCGASNPARVPKSAVAVIFVIAACIVIAALFALS